MVLPYYCMALLQPHATLLSWGAFAASHHIVQASLARPAWASQLGMPALLLPAPEGGQSSSSTPDNSELLLFLGRRYVKMRRTAAATACFRLALQAKEDFSEAKVELKILEQK